MNTFQITIRRKLGDSWPVEVEEGKEGVFLPVSKVGLLEIETEPTELPKKYGTVLGKALFTENIRDAFVQALRDSGDCLHVFLFIEDAQLKTWRWERLCAPFDGIWDFLALNQRTPFSLYLPSFTDRMFPPIGRLDLRALVLVVSPRGLEPYALDHFDVVTAASSVKASLGKIPCDVLAEVEGAAGPPTLDALCERLTHEPYTLLHVVCHGQFDPISKDTNLFLGSGDPQKPLDRVSGTLLIERLRKLGVTHGLPRLAFLATCESASPKAEGALGGLAQLLVRELGMPAVVAMTEKVSVKTAEALAEGFYRRIREHGEVDRALAEATAALAGRYDITVPALFSRLGGLPLFSDTLDRPLTPKEIELGLSRLGDLVKERAPVLSPEFEGQAAKLRATMVVDPAALSAPARDERKKALEEVNKLCGEVLDLSFNALALGKEPSVYDGRCPFRGLYPFKSEDQEFFFGREKLVEVLHQKLAEYNFLAVLGPSGCGKSSLVMAGLIPAMEIREPGLRMEYMTPGSDPFAHLEANLSKRSAIGNQPSAVLVVDQFEELFTLCADESKRQAFLDRLLTLPEKQRVVITMRADFWGDCANYTALKETMLAHQELIAPMDSAELRRAMEGQAQRVGLRFEADLSNTILDEVQGEPGAMPLLQHALLELWKRRHGRWLLSNEYREKIGGVRQAIARTADEIYKHSSKEDRERIRNIFIRLTRLADDTGSEQERRETRRRRAMLELVAEGDSLESVRKLVHRLGSENARLVVIKEKELGATPEEAEVDVAHEALIRYWPRLRTWLDEDRAGIRLREGISQAAREWRDKGKEGEDESLLIHRGRRLEDAEALSRHPRFKLNELERAYVNACIALREKERFRIEEQRRRELETAHKLAEEAEARRNAEEKARREAEKRVEDGIKSAGKLRKRLRVAIGLGVAAIAAAIIALYASWLAEKQSRISFSRELATDASVQISKDPDLSVRLSLMAISWAYTEEAERALRDSMAALAESHRRALLIGHKESVRSASFSQDGERIVTASEDKTAAIWDAKTGKKLLDLNSDNQHQDIVYCARFNKDRTLVASSSKDKKVKIWDAESGEMIRQLPEFGTAVRCLSFSPDSRSLAVGCDDGFVSLWDVETGKFVLEVDPEKKHEGVVYSIAFNHDGKLIATASKDKSAKVWDSKSGKMICELREHNGPVRSASFSNKGGMLVTGSEDKLARIWDLNSAKTIMSLKDHDDWVQAAVFCPKDQYVATGSKDSKIRVWDLHDGTKLIELDGHKGGVNSLEFSSNGEYLVSASGDGTARVWETKAKQKFFKLGEKETHAGSVRCANYSYDGNRIVTAGEDNVARIWDTNTQKLLVELVGHKGWVTSASFSPEGDRIVTSSGDKTACIWDSGTGKKLLELIGHKGWVYSAAFSSEGNRIITASQDTTACVWNAATGKKLFELKGHIGRVLYASFSKTRNRIITTGEDGSAKVWDGEDGRLLFELVGHKGWVTSASFSPEGDRIVTSSGDKTASIWDSGTGKKLFELIGHKGWVYSAAFSSEGNRIITASQDTTACVWDAATGNKLFELLRQTGWVYSAAFSPKGDGLLTASEDKNVRVYCDELCWSLETLFSRSKFVRKLTEAEKAIYLHQYKTTEAVD